MSRLFRSPAEEEDPAHLPETQPHGVSSVAKGRQSAWRWLIGYNDIEAHRIGVPMVSSKDWLGDIFNHPGSKAAAYLDSLFPFTHWITRYNLQWGVGDLIAGITVALVLVPQSMSYATLAGLRPEYGLYSSLTGVVLYPLFATSKDVSVGPVAVMSLQTSNVIVKVMSRTDAWSPEVIASALAFMCGVITLGLGLLRLGWITEFIPSPGIAGFTTGSAITIAASQVPKLMGISGVNTNGQAAYRVIIDTLKGLPRTKIDAAFGLTALFSLYAIRSACVHIPRRYPKAARVCFFISVFRSAFVIIVLTIAARLWVGNNYTYAQQKSYPISLLKTVPRGFQHVGVPNLNTTLLSDMASELPVSAIVLLLEHIAISRSFGRQYGYRIVPSQELLAIGATNIFGPFLGGYAATGSFSRSAIKAKSGVRTPLAGWVTAVLVVIALYALNGVFYWIPSAALSAIIIHAVIDLLASPRAVYRFWLISPFEMLIFLAAVFVSVFSSLENGVYTSIGASLVLLLVRIAKPRASFLGTVDIRHDDSPEATQTDNAPSRVAFVPLDDRGGLRDPSVKVTPPPPGVLMLRFEEAFTYPNASALGDFIIQHVKTVTRPGRASAYARPGDRPWNDPGPINPLLAKVLRPFTFSKAKRNLDAKIGEAVGGGFQEDPRPVLRAFIFDFSSVANVDTTSVQTLVDVRAALERYAGQPIEFHFATLLSPWVRRALLAGGFGTGSTQGHVIEIAPVVSTRNALGPQEQALRRIEEHTRRRRQEQAEDKDSGSSSADRVDDVDVLDSGAAASTSRPTSSVSSTNKDRLAEEGAISRNDEDDDDAGSAASVAVLWGADLCPAFHLDLSAALAAATAAVKK